MERELSPRRAALLSQLGATRATLLAAVAQLDAQLEAFGEEPETEEFCPRCEAYDLASAGDVSVCGTCGANIRNGEVVSG